MWSLLIYSRPFVFIKKSSAPQSQFPQSQQIKPTLSQNTLSPSLVGKWEVVSVEENNVQIVSSGNGATIEFFENGTHKASGGCNKMFHELPHATYKIQPDSKLSISAGGTKKRCAKNIVEFWDLNRVYAYEFIDNVLLLYYKTDNRVEGSFKLIKSSSGNIK